MKPVLFEVLGFPIHSYGLMLAIGFLLGIWKALKSNEKYKISKDNVYDLCLICLVSGILGSRLVYILLNLQTESFSKFFVLWQGGLSFHGGLALALLAGYIYTKRKNISFLTCGDLFAPAVAIGYAVTRIGCFLNGCCYGAPCSLPWAVRFNEFGTLTPPSHPTQIYAMIANFIIAIILSIVQKKDHEHGYVFILWIGLYGVYRFINEFFRKGYSAEVFAGGITEAQVISIIMIVISAFVLLLKYKKTR
ncbi:MAG: prolipoprotein diacylglyceryl transferase [Armatimonadota bacterium]